MDMASLRHTSAKDRPFWIVISLDKGDALKVAAENVCREEASHPATNDNGMTCSHLG
jgi:hypothetical protein